MREGSPREILPTVSPGDRLRCFFDRYNPNYADKPDSPLETEVLDVDVDEVTEAEDPYPGTRTTVSLRVAGDDDDKADSYWIEHRTERIDNELEERVSDLLYEETLGTFSTSGSVGHIDTIEVLEDDATDS